MHGGEFSLGPSLLREVAARGGCSEEPWACLECEYNNEFQDEFICLSCGEPAPDGRRDGMAGSGAPFWQAAWDSHQRDLVGVEVASELSPHECPHPLRSAIASGFRASEAQAPEAGKVAAPAAATNQQQTTPLDGDDEDQPEDEDEELVLFDELELGSGGEEEEETPDYQKRHVVLVLELAPQVCGPLGQHLSDGSRYRVTDQLPRGVGGILWCNRERAPVTLSARYWLSDFHGEQWMVEKDLLVRLIQLGRGRTVWSPESFVLCQPGAETGSLRSQHMAFIGCFIEQQREEPHLANVWIVKPARDRRSQGITISDDLSVLLGACVTGEKTRSVVQSCSVSLFCLAPCIH